MLKALISDFDGTLVDTFDANLGAYQTAFRQLGLELTAEAYRASFGLRFDDFMAAVGIADATVAARIRELKKQCYPQFFHLLRPNLALLALIRSCRSRGMKTALASTARRENLINALSHIGAAADFDLIFAGMDVRHGKPHPEIYLNTMEALGVQPEETLIIEDSAIGTQAALASGAQCLKIVF